jgi:hypothetical protein
MTDVLKIKPAPGRAVRDPVTMKPLAADGETKPRTSFWTRRLADGDVLLTDAEDKTAVDTTATAEVLTSAKKGAK